MGVGLAGDPVFPVTGESATGDDAVDVDMQSEVLAPGVQDHDDPQFRAQVLGVSPKGLEGVSGRVE